MKVNPYKIEKVFLGKNANVVFASLCTSDHHLNVNYVHY